MAIHNLSNLCYLRGVNPKWFEPCRTLLVRGFCLNVPQVLVLLHLIFCQNHTLRVYFMG
jgi:hypothetical protein